MSTVGIIGNLTWDEKEMMLRATNLNPQNVKKIRDECSLIDPNDINWLNVDRNTWFICLNFTTNKGYYFPICEEENRENNYGRVKQGMKYFISKGWEAYKIQ